MPANDFFSKLQAKNYVPKSRASMEQDLADGKTKKDHVSLTLLKSQLRSLNPVKGVGSLNEANQKMGRFDVKVRKDIQVISSYMQNKHITTE
jgi:hypothetical protein